MLRDIEFYRPHFAPWEGLGEFKDVMAKVAPYSDVSADRVWVLYTLAQQALHVPGDFWECGVFRGGTATALARVLSSAPGKKLHLFDTFSGLPAGKSDRDFHPEGLYSDTSLEGVKSVVGRDDFIHYHRGLIPDTFKGMESQRVAFAHIDVAIYQSILDCCAFIYPRLSGGGFMVFDDYGFRSCPGARLAVDEFFADKPERPLVLPTRQAVVVKLPGGSA
jgi:O-methyltransferase